MKPRRRYVVRAPRTLPRPPGDPAPGQRELLAVREIVHAFLHADQPQEALQFAVDRVGPVVGAAFASVYLVDGASELMRLVAAFNWPERYRPWLSDVRVRVGFGPSGEAASERRVIEVPDVFADPDLEDWQDVARELGFRAIVALPLESNAAALGAVTFYFRDWEDFTVERRGLLRLVADLMAAAAEKSRLVDRVRRAEAAAVEALTELDHQYVAVAGARRAGGDFADLVAAELRRLLADLIAEPGAPAAMAAAREMLDDLTLLADLVAGRVEPDVGSFDPRTPLREALRAVVPADPDVHVVAEEPGHDLPMARGDRGKLANLLARLMARAVMAPDGTELRVRLVVTLQRVEYRLPGRVGADLGWRVIEAMAEVVGAGIEPLDDGAAGPAGLLVTVPLEPAARSSATTNRRDE